MWFFFLFVIVLCCLSVKDFDVFFNRFEVFFVSGSINVIKDKLGIEFLVSGDFLFSSDMLVDERVVVLEVGV